MKEHIRLGEALVKAGLIDNLQLQSALGRQRQWGGRIGTTLIDMGFIDEGTLIKFLSGQLKFPAVDLSKSHISPIAFAALPRHVAEKYIVAPVLVKNTPGKKTLVLAMADPTDLKAIDEIEFLTNFKVESVVALESAIKRVLATYGTEMEPEEGESAGIALVDGDSKKVEFVQGDIAMLDEVQKVNAVGTANKKWPTEKAAPSPLVDFSAPPLEEFEVAPRRKKDDSFLEMVPEEAVAAPADVIEDAEIVEDAKPMEEPAEFQADANRKSETRSSFFSDDPYEYDAGVVENRDEVGHIRPTAETHHLGEEDEHVAVVGSFEELEAKTAKYHAEPAKPSEPEKTEEPEAQEMIVADTEAEAVEETEYDGEAVEEAAVESASELEEEPAGNAEYVVETDEIPTVEQADDLEAGPVEEGEDVSEVAEEVAIKPPIEVEVVEEAQAFAENVSETTADLVELRAEIARMATKIEGLVSLFILHANGKLSTKEFIDELRNL